MYLEEVGGVALQGFPLPVPAAVILPREAGVVVVVVVELIMSDLMQVVWKRP